MGQFSPQQIISRGLGLILYRKQTTRYPTQPKSPQTPYCCSKLQTPTVARLKPSPQLLFSQWPVYTSKTQLQPKKTEERKRSAVCHLVPSSGTSCTIRSHSSCGRSPSTRYLIPRSVSPSFQRHRPRRAQRPGSPLKRCPRAAVQPTASLRNRPCDF